MINRKVLTALELGTGSLIVLVIAISLYIGLEIVYPIVHETNEDKIAAIQNRAVAQITGEAKLYEQERQGTTLPQLLIVAIVSATIGSVGGAAASLYTRRKKENQ